jgi:hypothetical protein
MANQPQQPPNNGTRNNTPIISEDTFRKLMDVEGKKVELELQKTTLAAQKQADNTELAKISINANKEVYLAEKSDKRKDIILYAIIGFIAMIFLVVCGKYLLETAHKDILIKIIEFLIYIGSIYFSYKQGVKKGKSNNDGLSDEN